jgi:hypothetical protein
LELLGLCKIFANVPRSKPKVKYVCISLRVRKKVCSELSRRYTKIVENEFLSIFDISIPSFAEEKFFCECPDFVKKIGTL